MAYLTSIDDLRAIQWGVTYDWDIRFPDAPFPFSKFFPAVEVSEPQAALQFHQETFFIDTYRIPWNKLPQDLRIVFHDNTNGILLDWIQRWINKTIFNNGAGVSPIGTDGVCKRVHISKLNSKREIVKTSAYWVFPDGVVDFLGNNAPDVLTYSINFVIAGIIERGIGGTLPSPEADDLKVLSWKYTDDPNNNIAGNLIQTPIPESDYLQYEVPMQTYPDFPPYEVAESTWYESAAYNLTNVKTRLVTVASDINGYASTFQNTVKTLTQSAAQVINVKNKIEGVVSQVRTLKTQINRLSTAKNLTQQASALSSIANKVSGIGLSSTAISGVYNQLLGSSNRITKVARDITK